jgi:RNA polymerase sigma factor (TIGR02999 family)
MTATSSASYINADLAFEAAYIALRKQAQRYLRREQNAFSLSPTVLTHEAWMALAKSRNLKVVDGAHYAKLVGRIMKNLLIDHARRRRSISNGGAVRRVELHEAVAAPGDDTDRILAVGAALDKLAADSPSLAELVELRYFAGFTEEEVAQIMGTCGRTVRRQWGVARLRLLDALSLDGEVA